MATAPPSIRSSRSTGRTSARPNRYGSRTSAAPRPEVTRFQSNHFSAEPTTIQNAHFFGKQRCCGSQSPGARFPSDDARHTVGDSVGEHRCNPASVQLEEPAGRSATTGQVAASLYPTRVVSLGQRERQTATDHRFHKAFSDCSFAPTRRSREHSGPAITKASSANCASAVSMSPTLT
jgi:hypothetical protein